MGIYLLAEGYIVLAEGPASRAEYREIEGELLQHFGDRGEIGDGLTTHTQTYHDYIEFAAEGEFMVESRREIPIMLGNMMDDIHKKHPNITRAKLYV